MRDHHGRRSRMIVKNLRERLYEVGQHKLAMVTQEHTGSHTGWDCRYTIQPVKSECRSGKVQNVLVLTDELWELMLLE